MRKLLFKSIFLYAFIGLVYSISANSQSLLQTEKINEKVSRNVNSQETNSIFSLTELQKPDLSLFTKAASKKAASTRSTTIIFQEDFYTESSFDRWRVRNLNGDFNYWRYNSSNKTAEYNYSSIAADDWLFSPEFNLEAEKTYKIVYTVQNTIDSYSNYKEDFKVVVSPTIEPEDAILIADHPQYDQGKKTITQTFTIPQDGSYRIGFHVYSPADQYTLSIHDVMVLEDDGVEREYETVFEEDFDTESSFDRWRVRDLNQDYYYWRYDANEKAAKYSYNSREAANDWLFSPEIGMIAGATYEITYSVSNAGYPENFKAVVSPTIEPEDAQIIADHPNYNEGKRTYIQNFTVDIDGNYRIGFHVYSAADQLTLMVHDVIVKKEIITVIETEPLPFNETFESEEDFEKWSVIDVMEDGKTWTYDTSKQAAKYTYGSVDADDWLFTPAFELSANTIYEVKYKIQATSSSMRKENFELVVSSGVDPLKATSIVQHENYNSGTRSFTQTFSVEEDGIYYVGLHIYSEKNQDNVYLHELSVEAKRMPKKDGEVPLYEPFLTEEDFNDWTVIDNNNDEVTWGHVSTLSNTAARYRYGNIQADDWLFSPGVKLYPGVLYELNYNVEGTNYTESFKTVISPSTEVDETDMIILGDYPAYKGEPNDFSHSFMVPTEGIYYIGFYVYSAKNQNVLYINEVSLDLKGHPEAPGLVKDLVITPSANGELNVNLSFKAPLTTANGEELSEITSIEIYRNDEETPAKVFETPVPGEILEWTDTEAIEGINKYTIIPYNSKGMGAAIEETVYVGMDVPERVKNLVLDIVDSKPVISWEAPVIGANGGTINPDEVKYMILRRNEIIEVEHTGTTFVDQGISPDQQYYLYYWVIAYNEEGVGEMESSNIVKYGNPYSIPYKESFSNASQDRGPWLLEEIESHPDNKESIKWEYVASLPWGAFDPDPQDKDRGFIYFNSADTYAGSSMRLISPKLDMSEVKNPWLSFWFYHYKGNDSKEDRLQIEISTDGETYTDLNGALIRLAENNNGWTEYRFSLKEYVGEYQINISFKGISDYGNHICLDNIVVEDVYENDLEAISLDGPRFLKIPNTGNYIFTLKNKGENKVLASDYQIELYRDNALHLSQDGEDIDSQSTINLTFEVASNFDDDGNVYSYYAVINYSADENKNNNQTNTITTSCVTSGLPGVTDLTGEVEENSVSLTWSEPHYNTEAGEKTTEGFESYEPFIIDNIGEWTVVDGDGGETYAPNGTEEGAYPNVYQPMAFQVYNPEEADSDIGSSETYKPYSGKQYLVAWGTPSAAVDPMGAAPNDDWLISPELSGNGESVTFYAKGVVEDYGLEKFQVLYSTTDKDTANFIPVHEQAYLEVGARWTEFNFTLPVGAKYFAIRYISDDVWALMIDEISYQVQGLRLIGYNVYRDGEKLNDREVRIEEYKDSDLERGTYNYRITTVYVEGESGYSNEYSVVVGEDNIGQTTINGYVYVLPNTIVIKDALDQNISVYSIDGKQIYSLISSKEEYLNVDKGTYLVKIGDQVVKVQVK